MSIGKRATAEKMAEEAAAVIASLMEWHLGTCQNACLFIDIGWEGEREGGMLPRFRWIQDGRRCCQLAKSAEQAQGLCKRPQKLPAVLGVSGRACGRYVQSLSCITLSSSMEAGSEMRGGDAGRQMLDGRCSI